MEKKRGRPYSLGLAALILGTLTLGAFALTVIFAGEAAFPVEVFGNASAERRESGPSLRGSAAGEVLHGFLRDFELPPEETGDYALAGSWAAADPQLDRARTLSGVGEWDEALGIYEALVEARPNSEELALERARVLSWSGDAVAAAQAVEEVARTRPGDAALRVEAAQYYWWAGEAEEADRLLTEARRLGAVETDVAALQQQVRGAYTPGIESARRWVEDENSWTNRVVLARAYLAEEQWIPAIQELDRALATGSAPDSLYLDIAAAATAADSAGLAITALREYVRLNPDDTQARLSLARSYSWDEQFESSAVEYERYLEIREDPEARFELAQILSWMERNDAAARELRRVATARPLHAPTYRLLGDLALWSGDYELAIANYRYASDLAPADVEIRTALRQAETEFGRAQMAAMPLPLGDCAINFESFSDSEGFTWVETSGSRTWRGGWGAVEVRASQALSQGEHAFSGAQRRLGGMGAAVALYLPISRTASIDLLAGTKDYGDFGSYVQAGIGIEARNVAGTDLSARYTRGPAIQRAATVASLQARTTSDLLQLTAGRPIGDWSSWSSVEAERLSSQYGTTFRYGANLAMSRSLSSRVMVTAALSALTTSGDAPTLPDGRSLYWTPELYVAPSVGVTYRMPVGESWSVAGTVTPGWTYVRERPTGEQRFGRNNLPTLGAALEIGYSTGDWNITGLANWGGSVDPTGYRASTVRVQGSYLLGEP